LPRASETARNGLSTGLREAGLALRDSVNADLEQLLTEIAFVLLPRGVTPQRFSRIARQAFIRAAAERSRLKNGRINRSKVAALTGLTRREIKQILDRDKSSATPKANRAASTPSARVVHGWLTDRRFLTRQGRPKMLSNRGSQSPFQRLVKDYGGDISPRAVQEELVLSKMIRIVGRQLELRTAKISAVKAHSGPLSRVLPALIDALRIASVDRRNKLDPVLYRLRLNADNETELGLIRERCQSGIKLLLEGLQESLANQVTIPARRRTVGHTIHVTVLLADNRAQRS
jgi:hypothetical protein